MKKKIIVVIAVVIIIASSFYGGIKVGAAGTGAGSVSDPLITQSYLEKRLSELVDGAASFTAISVDKGKSFYPAEGTQFFLYSGGGTVNGKAGLIDLTGGQLFSDGNIMVKYHLFLAPVSGSGVTLSSDAVIYVMGTYSIK